MRDPTDKYNPIECKSSINMDGIYICSLQTTICALHKKKKCYMQAVDELLGLIASDKEEVNKENDEGTR